MSFIIKDDDVLDKYYEIWNKIKNTLNIKFHSTPVYHDKYIKAKVWEFNGVIKTNFLRNEVPKENVHYTCVACITIDSTMKIQKNNFQQVYLEECKYRIKKIKMSKFINTNFESESESELESSLCSTYVTYGTWCHARCHLHFPSTLYHKCYGFESIFYLAFLPAAFKASLRPAVYPQR